MLSFYSLFNVALADGQGVNVYVIDRWDMISSAFVTHNSVANKRYLYNHVATPVLQWLKLPTSD